MITPLPRFLCLALAASSGCSFALLRLPPSTPIETPAPIECTTSPAWPAADLLAGLAGAGVGIAAVASDSPACPPVDGREWTIFPCLGPRGVHAIEVAAGVVMIGIGAVALASSAYGFERTARCARLKGWQAACDGGDGAACAALGIGWPMPREGALEPRPAPGR